jgi:SacI homology domain
VQLDSGVAAQFCSYLQMRGSIPTYWYAIHSDLQVLSTLVLPISSCHSSKVMLILDLFSDLFKKMKFRYILLYDSLLLS